MSVSVISRNLHGPTELPIASEQRRSDRSQACEVIELRGPVRRLSRGELLFGAGDPKTQLYRVESGSLCIYEPRCLEYRAVIEFAYPGDLLGLGYLENHTRSARAIAETQITCLPLSAVNRIVEASPISRDRLKQAIDDELEFVRDALVRSGQRNSVERLAAFIVALSRGNSYEGRDANIITDSMRCGVVASYLALSVESLASALVKLEEQGLIENCPPLGLRLNDINALEQLAFSHTVMAPCTRRDQSASN